MRRRQFPFSLLLPCLLTDGAMAAQPPGDFWFIFLETGRKTPDDKEAVAAMQRGHIENFKRLFALKQLYAAGPLRDPSGFKRGIVTVRAASREELQGYFQPDEYVREGYMTVNAARAHVHRGLNTEGIDPDGIEEVRIVQIGRATAAVDEPTARAQQAMLQGLIDRGTVGAWYTLHSGPVAEVLFARAQDTVMLGATLAGYPGLGSAGVSLEVWKQWLGKGVLR